jgi:hypothetical protein
MPGGLLAELRGCCENSMEYFGCGFLARSFIQNGFTLAQM